MLPGGQESAGTPLYRSVLSHLKSCISQNIVCFLFVFILSVCYSFVPFHSEINICVIRSISYIAVGYCKCRSMQMFSESVSFISYVAMEL